MPAPTKQQQSDRLAAAHAIIEASGGLAQIDGLATSKEFAAAYRRMAKQLAGQFASEGMRPETCRIYIAKALRQLRGEVAEEDRRGGYREGGGIPPGTRKCKNCKVWNVAASPNGETWQCKSCHAIHPKRVDFLKPGETFDIRQSLQEAIDYGLITEDE